MSPLFLANAILVTHVAFVAFVVLAVPVILFGKWRGWGWVHSPLLRIGHFAAIAFVMVNTWLGQMCPLTVWENDLRQQAGVEGNGESFIAYWLSQLLFWDLPSWAFTAAYTAFGLLVLALLWLVPIRGKRTPP